eukprot:1943623-Prymnesium_polylepis.1
MDAYRAAFGAEEGEEDGLHLLAAELGVVLQRAHHLRDREARGHDGVVEQFEQLARTLGAFRLLLDALHRADVEHPREAAC